MWRWRMQDAESGGTPRSQLGAALGSCVEAHVQWDGSRVARDVQRLRCANGLSRAAERSCGNEAARVRANDDRSTCATWCHSPSRVVPPLWTSTVARMMRKYAT